MSHNVAETRLRYEICILVDNERMYLGNANQFDVDTKPHD
jgi:hypothetical protein